MISEFLFLGELLRGVMDVMLQSHSIKASTIKSYFGVQFKVQMDLNKLSLNLYPTLLIFFIEIFKRNYTRVTAILEWLQQASLPSPFHCIQHLIAKHNPNIDVFEKCEAFPSIKKWALFRSLKGQSLAV